MKTVPITAILIIAVGLSVSQDQDREKRSISVSDEFAPRFYLPPYQYPFSQYPPILNQAYPGYRFYLVPVPFPQFRVAASPPIGK